MTGVLVEIPRTKWVSQRNLRLDKSLRDATADHLRRLWPQHTAKYAAREYGLSVDRAREAVAGRASLTTIEAIFKSGGLFVAVPIIEDVVGQQFAHVLRELRANHEEDGKRLAALAGDHLSVVAGGAPDRADADPTRRGRTVAVGRRGADRQDRRTEG